MPRLINFSFFMIKEIKRVVESLACNRGAAGLRLARDTVLCPWTRRVILCLVRTGSTQETSQHGFKLLTGTWSINASKSIFALSAFCVFYSRGRGCDCDIPSHTHLLFHPNDGLMYVFLSFQKCVWCSLILHSTLSSTRVYWQSTASMILKKWNWPM